MAESAAPNAGDISSAIRRVLPLLGEHPYVRSIGHPEPLTGTGWCVVPLRMHVDLPSTSIAKGVTPDGVRSEEPVSLLFPPEYPIAAPTPVLREDFNCGLAHVQPVRIAGKPVPCIYDGKLTELIASRGMLAFMNQLAEWLNRAAMGMLIDRDQGWEPTRRDGIDDTIVADGGWLRRNVTPGGGRIFAVMRYLRFEEAGSACRYLHCSVLAAAQPFNAASVGRLFTATPRKHGTERGSSLALFAWPGTGPDGKPFIADKYVPETVRTIADLYERAALYGCQEGLRSGLDWLRRSLPREPWDLPSPLGIVLAARRPMPVIGTGSAIELSPYVVEILPPTLFGDPATHPVRIAALHDVVSVPLLRRMSADADEAATPRWTLVGAGSLGSKVGFHLARAGRAPERVIDNGWLSPHHAARHALLPESDGFPFSKADAFAAGVSKLGQVCVPHNADVATLLRAPKTAHEAFPKRAWAAVNATASVVVREAFGAAELDLVAPRVVEAGLFARGSAGYLTVEGPDRNPNTLDLIAALYHRAGAEPRLAGAVFGAASSHDRIDIGEGCGSLTMPMSDAHVSQFAAPMARLLRRMQVGGLRQREGETYIALEAEDGISLMWQHTAVPPVTVVSTGGEVPWHARLSHRVHGLIVEEVSRWPKVETGGILLGRFSETARTFFVVDILDAPQDTQRTADRFTLGTKGVKGALRRYVDRHAGALYCLGTWHSHLEVSGPSLTDLGTVGVLALSQAHPALSLIYTPGGYRMVVAHRHADLGQ